MEASKTPPLHPDTIKTAQAVQKMYGSNYYAATLLLPKNVRQAVFIFYAFVRLADELVDNPRTSDSAVIELEKYELEWKTCYQTGVSDNDIFLAFRDICLSYQIEYNLTKDFLTAMKADTHTSRYETYEDLEGYMYGSAEVIGIILTKLFGCYDEAALPHARALGSAMQLTNFLRDIIEDFELRDRVYIPQTDLKKFGVAEAALIEQPSSDTVRELMKYEVKRALTLYQHALKGVSYLPKSVRPAVRAASALYRELLNEIARNEYAVPRSKIRLSTFKKIRLALLYGYVKK